MKTRRKRPQGFTLVEIMIVILIIGMLLTIAIPNFISARQNSRAKAVIHDLQQVESAKDRCALDQGLTAGDDCPDAGMAAYMKVYPPNWPVSGGTFVKNPIGTEATFKGKTANQWLNDMSGL